MLSYGPDTKCCTSRRAGLVTWFVGSEPHENVRAHVKQSLRISRWQQQILKSSTGSAELGALVAQSQVVWPWFQERPSSGGGNVNLLPFFSPSFRFTSGVCMQFTHLKYLSLSFPHWPHTWDYLWATCTLQCRIHPTSNEPSKARGKSPEQELEKQPLGSPSRLIRSAPIPTTGLYLPLVWQNPL